ncbi:MAG TPA: phosphoenolpyruvate--protein phosphotransferase [Spirochaetia bacterium]|nr:phosphoenolpyruvate--protein phosphotransferase [Spirochaetia bacterium]
MVGLVIVSHSKKLAEAVGELVAATTVTPIPIATSGGVGEAHGSFGTDAVDVLEAIESVYSPSGVVVLADLGSAVMSAETALELLGPERSGNVRICAAPLVEGGVSAAAQIAINSSLDQVVAEALSALAPKQDHLGEGGGTEAAAPTPEHGAAPPSHDAPHAESRITVHNVHGLHARPASRFVQTVGRFASDVKVSNLTRQAGPVSGRSLNKISTLGVRAGDQILVTAVGNDAKAAVDALEQLAQTNFGDRDDAGPPGPASADGSVEKLPSRPGALVPVSDGIAVAPAAHLRGADTHVEPRKVTDVAGEVKKLDSAIEAVAAEIDKRIARLRGVLSADDLEIFVAHKAILRDPDLHRDVVSLISDGKDCAEFAWITSIERVAADYRALDDDYLRMRAADVRDVGNEVLGHLTDRGATHISFAEPTILLAEELGPSETASLGTSGVVGIITALGGPTSHAAIIARSLGIPSVTGYADLGRIRDGQVVAIDGFEGAVVVEPSADVRDRYIRKRDQWREKRRLSLGAALQPATTADGVTLPVFANIGSPEEAEAAANAGADGIGLLRTEFLFLDRKVAPTEDEQYEALRRVGRAFAGKPIVVRTLDVGGDKDLPYVELEHEDNPFLGVRGVRLYERIQPLVTAHLRAILRAGFEFDMRIMVPMIAEARELRGVLAWLERVHAELELAGIAHRWPVTTGIMVETPSAVQLSADLAAVAKFFSIGTNDLTQYTMAAERGNTSLSDYADSLHPAVLRSIRQTVIGAHNAGIHVAVCGEIAGDIAALPALLGLDVDEVSLNASKIPDVKECVRRSTREGAARLVDKLLRLDSAASVREALASSTG